MAADMGLVQDGMMPGVRLHGEPGCLSLANALSRSALSAFKTIQYAEQWRVTESEEKAGPSGSFMSQGEPVQA